MTCRDYHCLTLEADCSLSVVKVALPERLDWIGLTADGQTELPNDYRNCFACTLVAGNVVMISMAAAPAISQLRPDTNDRNVDVNFFKIK